MNERIVKLISEADAYASTIVEKYTPDSGEVSYLWEDAFRKKFAEMIVKECVQQCESVGELAEQTNFGEMARKTKATAAGCAQMIKWRFGVEE